MPRHGLRGRSRKHIQVRIPGNRTVRRYKKDKIKRAHCVRCGLYVAGVAPLTPTRSRQLLPTARRVERAYGGQLCSNCLSHLLKQAVRTQQT